MSHTTEHSQRFLVLGHVGVNGLTTMYERPTIHDHLPQLDNALPIYNVLGEGFDYLYCAHCFPRAGQVKDNRRAPGA